MKLNFYEDGNEVQEQNIPHKLKKLGMGGSQKLPKRILEPLLKTFCRSALQEVALVFSDYPWQKIKVGMCTNAHKRIQKNIEINGLIYHSKFIPSKSFRPVFL